MPNLTVYKGDDKDFTLTLKDSSNNAIDITDDTIVMTVKATDSDTASAVISSNATLTSPTTGVATFSLSNTDTAITAGEYFYDVQRTHDSKVSTLMKGKFIVTQDITGV